MALTIKNYDKKFVKNRFNSCEISVVKNEFVVYFLAKNVCKINYSIWLAWNIKSKYIKDFQSFAKKCHSKRKAFKDMLLVIRTLQTLALFCQRKKTFPSLKVYPGKVLINKGKFLTIKIIFKIFHNLIWFNYIKASKKSFFS